MADEIIYDNSQTFILEKGNVNTGRIISYSLDGANYDFTQTTGSTSGTTIINVFEFGSVN